jgi:hypothetical protein
MPCAAMFQTKGGARPALKPWGGVKEMANGTMKFTIGDTVDVQAVGLDRAGVDRLIDTLTIIREIVPLAPSPALSGEE